jgi:hypothetical protein
MARRKKVWLYKPPRQPKPRVPESTKSEENFEKPSLLEEDS